jgi:hypothetical protein
LEIALDLGAFLFGPLRFLSEADEKASSYFLCTDGFWIIEIQIILGKKLQLLGDISIKARRFFGKVCDIASYKRSVS